MRAPPFALLRPSFPVRLSLVQFHSSSSTLSRSIVPDPAAALSLARTHPSTRLIEEVFESIVNLGGIPRRCAKIIVADGVKVRDVSKFRAGVCTAEDEARYRRYLSRVHHLTTSARCTHSALHGATLLALDERHGFAHALRRGLMRVATPFVLVAQHDRSFVRVTDVAAVVRAMREANAGSTEGGKTGWGATPDVEEDEGDGSCWGDGDGSRPDDVSRPGRRRVNYVGFPTSTTIRHEHHVLSKYGLVVEGFELAVPQPRDRCGCDPSVAREGGADDATTRAPLRLLPLLQFYDSMHVASTRWYLSRVFGKKRYVNLPRGGFIEDTLGQHMLAKAREDSGVALHKEYFGVYLLQDDGVGRDGDEDEEEDGDDGDDGDDDASGDDDDDASGDGDEPVVNYTSAYYKNIARAKALRGMGKTKCGHIDGHDALTSREDCKKFTYAEAHTSEEAWATIEIEEELGGGGGEVRGYETLMAYKDSPCVAALPPHIRL